MSARTAVLGAAFCVSLLGLVACGRGDIVVPCPVPLEIVVAPASSTIAVGGTATFLVRIPDPCNQRVLPTRFAWSISYAPVATITSSTDSTVVLIGKAEGSATVTATSVVDPNVRGAGLLTVIFAPPPAVVR